MTVLKYQNICIFVKAIFHHLWKRSLNSYIYYYYFFICFVFVHQPSLYCKRKWFKPKAKDIIFNLIEVLQQKWYLHYINCGIIINVIKCIACLARLLRGGDGKRREREGLPFYLPQPSPLPLSQSQICRPRNALQPFWMDLKMLIC